MGRFTFYADLRARGKITADDEDEARARVQDLLVRWAQGQGGSVSVERVAVLAEAEPAGEPVKMGA